MGTLKNWERVLEFRIYLESTAYMSEYLDFQTRGDAVELLC